MPNRADQDTAEYYRAKAAEWDLRASHAATEKLRDGAQLVAATYLRLAQAVIEQQVRRKREIPTAGERD